MATGMFSGPACPRVSPYIAVASVLKFDIYDSADHAKALLDNINYWTNSGSGLEIRGALVLSRWRLSGGG